MKALDTHGVLGELCKAANLPGMFISFDWNFDDGPAEVFEAAPYLDPHEHGQILADGRGYLLFDDEEEMERTYWLTVGDDGPTETNPYNGKIRVYALTCSRSGQFLNENT